ncbi:hypothetical protein BOTNAR_0082g00010 [Botryotinia narcissicola]|uniref:Uncharacterized protein n=1 Tax=Botryotinia narcissicola TaxID=278944 RepID=A0A4Z1IUH2_9HELO|nr:hypothetical protein BOTNAR_0082g00010 [Botryotinia narcissicola]
MPKFLILDDSFVKSGFKHYMLGNVDAHAAGSVGKTLKLREYELFLDILVMLHKRAPGFDEEQV